MTSLVTSKFRVNNAFKFILGVASPGSALYAFMGKTLPWNTNGQDPGYSDLSPPPPLDTLKNEKRTWDSMLAAKHITGDNLRFGIPRYNYTSGSTYDAYSDQNNDLFRSRFYVYVASSGNVYKCISNNSNGISTVTPTGTNRDAISTADGYQWKYMFTVSANDAEYFMTPHYIPVSTLANNVWFNPVGPNPICNDLQGNVIVGHGGNNAYELGAFYVIVNLRFEYSEGGKITVTNDYRRIGLIDSPIVQSTGAVASAPIYKQTSTITFTGLIGKFNPDDQVSIGSVTANIVDAGADYITVSCYQNDLPTSGTITNQSGTTTATISTVTREELKKYTGSILFVEQRVPIARSFDQVEALNIVLEF